jgi:CRP-like cAMP-binding protein
MTEKSDLLRTPAFAGLPEEQIEWFISQSQDLTLEPEDTYVHQGDPADAMFVVLEGQLQGRGDIGGEPVTISIKTGDVTGALPYSRMKQSPLTGKAVTRSRVFRPGS